MSGHASIFCLSFYSSCSSQGCALELVQLALISVGIGSAQEHFTRDLYNLQDQAWYILLVAQDEKKKNKQMQILLWI